MRFYGYSLEMSDLNKVQSPASVLLIHFCNRGLFSPEADIHLHMGVIEVYICTMFGGEVMVFYPQTSGIVPANFWYLTREVLVFGLLRL